MYLLTVRNWFPKHHYFYPKIYHHPDRDLFAHIESILVEHRICFTCRKCPRPHHISWCFLGMVHLDVELRAIYERANSLPRVRLRRGDVSPVPLPVCELHSFLRNPSCSLLVKALGEEMAALQSTCPTCPIGSPLKANPSHVPVARSNV